MFLIMLFNSERNVRSTGHLDLKRLNMSVNLDAGPSVLPHLAESHFAESKFAKSQLIKPQKHPPLREISQVPARLATLTIRWLR
jgi:hypothetical protein